MIIKHFKVKSLNQNKDFDLSFNEDINILTGRNGSGKTTSLKLIWYLISGNIERIIPNPTEENAIFEKIEIETDTFCLSIRDNRLSETDNNRMSKTGRKKNGKCLFVEWDIGNGKLTRNMSIAEYGEKKFDQFLNQEILKVSSSSIFFPTFRRMEGGFFTTQRERKVNSFEEAYFIMQREGVYHKLGEGISDLSKVFSVDQHQFITSISTEDIVNYITRQYADISEKTNKLQKELAGFITKRTVPTFSDKERDEALSEIQSKVNEVTQKNDKLLQPFTKLSRLVADIFQYKGIKLTDNLTLGEATNALSSEKLSSGEKQMLSFLCYNAFYDKGIIFIDEPELSLHVDWQRISCCKKTGDEAISSYKL